MIKRIIKWFLLFIILSVVIIVGLYICSIDWSNHYTKHINALPIYDKDLGDGSYRIQLNDLEFHLRVRGNANKGTAVVLLHGFPESSIMWKPLMEKLANKGHRVFAFDQRGYSPGARPKGISNYHIDHLKKDVLDLAENLDIKSFHLIGHDWGAVVGWKVCIDHPNKVLTWTALTIPHIEVFMDAVINHPEQKKRSAYIHKLRLPILPEVVFRLTLTRIMNKAIETWTEEQIKNYKAILKGKRAITSVLNWYRALELESPNLSSASNKKVKVPTLFIWGNQDPVISADIIPLQEEYMDTSYTALELNSGHSLIQVKEQAVISAILSQLGHE